MTWDKIAAEIARADREGDHRPRVVLVSCGSFSPPTLMHMRLFETAKNHLGRSGPRSRRVVGGVMSPVHDAYGKAGLAPASNRVEMCRRAAEGSRWIEASDWETRQTGWTRTARVLAAYQASLDERFPPKGGRPAARVLLLCGSDLLRSALDPGVWDPALVRRLFGEFGVACLERVGTDAAGLVRESSLLREFESNIFVVPQRIENNVSSTSVRELLAEGLSVRYLVPDRVADYVEETGLYDGGGPGRQRL